jgi:hypothetical protein
VVAAEGERLGAYGLNLPDLAGSGRLGSAPPEWPQWRIRVTVDATVDIGAAEESLSDDQATIIHDPSGLALLDRSRSRTDLRLLASPSAEALVHPLLASTAIVANHWAGRATLHAGAFVFGGAVWGVLGAREDGKSSTLGWLVQAGHDVFTDDLLVIDGDAALAGPRCLDLRDEAAAHLGIGEPLGVVGNRERWRVALSPIPPRLPFGGWIRLTWAPEVRVRRLSLSTGLPILVRARALRTLIGDEVRWLDLATLPFVEFARPRRWVDMDAGMEDLLGVLRRLT